METGGVVTIMHADVEGSTALATRAGDDLARRVLTETKSVVRERCEERGGRQIDAVGDAMMLTFVSTRAAIGAAMDIQESIAARERERPDEALRVRIGINVGEVLGHDTTPFGAAVNAGARVMSLADGGEVLVSEMAQRLAGTIPGVAFRDRGRHAFKGFDEPWRVFRVEWEGAPPPRPKKRPRRRLLVPIATAGVVVVVAAIAVVVTTGGGGTKLHTLRPGTVGLFDERRHAFVSDVLVGAGPVALASSESTLWVGNGDGETVTRVDQRTRAPGVTIPVGGHPAAIAANSHGAWVAEPLNRRLVRIDGEFNRAVGVVPVAADSVVLAGGSLWDTAATDDALERRDPVSGRLISRKLLDYGAHSLAVTGDTLWVVGGGRATPFDPTRGIATGPAVLLTGQPDFVAAVGNRLWLLGQVLQEVDTDAGGVMQTLQLGIPPPTTAAGFEALAATPTAAYVADPSGGVVLRVDVRTRAVERLRVGATPRALLATTSGVWVSVS